MDDLKRLKLLTDETDEAVPPVTGEGNEGGCDCAAALSLSSTRMFTDQQLLNLLELHGGDVDKTAYDVLIRKAENTGVRLSGGTELPDQRDYWLGRARSVRPNGTKAAGRADRT